MPHFHLGWAHCGKNQHPHLSRRVEEFNAGRTGCRGKHSHKVSAEAVQARLEYIDGHLLLSEVPVVGQIRVVYQKRGQRRYPAEQKGRKIEDGVQIVLVSGLRDQLLPSLR